MNIAISTAAPAQSAPLAPSVSKSHILGALRKMLRSRPGLEFANYGDLSAYRSDYRRINRQLNDGEILLAAVAWRDGITADHLLQELNGCGRLSWENGALHYTAGQYYPVEYRAAVCRALAAVLWDFWRREGLSPRNVAKDNFGRGVCDRYFN